jgi:DNA-binding Xre family transcriptional regulator
MDQAQPLEGSLYVTLKSYLERLEALERSKPAAQRRHVPGMDELARAVGIHPVTLSKIANSHIRQLNLETGGKIIAALRRYGFAMSVSDLIAYRGADEDIR